VEERIRTVAILGAGNGGCAAAADLGRRGVAVRLCGRSEQTLRPLRERGGIQYTGALGDGFVPVPVITRDPAEALESAELVILTVPTHAHEDLAASVAPHLKPGQVLMAAPGHTLLLIPSVLRRHGIRRPVMCETATLPYICRMAGPTQVRITRASRDLVFGVFPARETERFHALVAPVYPAIRPGSSILDTVFPYSNAIHHPPATLCNAGRIEATGGKYYHYFDGITPSVGRLIDVLDRERLAVAQALGATALPFVEQFFRSGYTTEAARESGLAYEAFHQSEPDRWIEAPSSLDHRFLNEDIPFGLVLLAELGRLAGVPTPSMDHLIHLAGLAAGQDFRSSGLTLARMGLAGISRAELERMLRDGYRD
jgi:opine dehydrogenase